MSMIEQIDYDNTEEEIEDLNIRLRLEALGNAIEYSKQLPEAQPEEIVNIANRFYNFLNGTANENVQANRN